MENVPLAPRLFCSGWVTAIVSAIERDYVPLFFTPPLANQSRAGREGYREGSEVCGDRLVGEPEGESFQRCCVSRGHYKSLL